MGESARLSVGGKDYDLPVVVGTEDERGIDVSKLLAASGHVTLDDGYANTGSTQSAVTFLDGERGILINHAIQHPGPAEPQADDHQSRAGQCTARHDRQAQPRLAHLIRAQLDVEHVHPAQPPISWFTSKQIHFRLSASKTIRWQRSA